MLPLPTSNDTLFSKNGTEAPKAKHSVPRPYYGLFAGDSRRGWATTLDSQGGERRQRGVRPVSSASPALPPSQGAQEASLGTAAGGRYALLPWASCCLSVRQSQKG